MFERETKVFDDCRNHAGKTGTLRATMPELPWLRGGATTCGGTAADQASETNASEQLRAVTCGEERSRLMALETRTRLPSAAHDEGGIKGVYGCVWGWS